MYFLLQIQFWLCESHSRQVIEQYLNTQNANEHGSNIRLRAVTICEVIINTLYEA